MDTNLTTNSIFGGAKATQEADTGMTSLTSSLDLFSLLSEEKKSTFTQKIFSFGDFIRLQHILGTGLGLSAENEILSPTFIRQGHRGQPIFKRQGGSFGALVLLYFFISALVSALKTS